jgi:hypothetical protein
MSRQHQIPTTLQEAHRIRAAFATALQRLLSATDHCELPALQQEARELIDLIPHCLIQIHEEQRRVEREAPPRFIVGSAAAVRIVDQVFERLGIASDRFLNNTTLEVLREQAGLGDDAVPSRVPDEIPNVTKGGRK